MSDDPTTVRGSDYRLARIAVAIVLTVVVAAVVVWDAISPAYVVDGFVLAALLGAIATLLAVELAGTALGAVLGSVKKK